MPFYPTVRASFALLAIGAAAAGCASASSSTAADNAPVPLTLAQRVNQVASTCFAACNAEEACYGASQSRIEECTAACRDRFDQLEIDSPSVRRCIDVAEAELQCFAALDCSQVRTYFLAEPGEDYPCAAEDRAWYESCAE